MEDDSILFALARQRDRDGAKRRRALHAHIACGEFRSAREWLLRVVVATSIPLALVAWWPVALHDRVRGVALLAWGSGFATLILAVLLEWGLRRLRAQLLREISPSTREGDRCDARG